MGSTSFSIFCFVQFLLQQGPPLRYTTSVIEKEGYKGLLDLQVSNINSLRGYL